MIKQPVDSIDNFWRNLDGPTNLMIITAVFEFDEPLDFNRLQETIENRWLVFERFKQRIIKTGFGGTKWEADPEFNIRSHLHRVALPEPGGREELQNMISDLTGMSLDPNKPLWHVHLIENYQGGCALFWRIHHCIADGISLSNVLLSTADRTADAQPKAAEDQPLTIQPRTVGAKKKSKTFSQYKDSILHALSVGGLQRATSDIINIGNMVGKQMIPEPRTAFKGRIGVRKLVAWSDSLSLADAKYVGSELGGTLNDVVVSSVTGALRRYLMEKHKPVSGLNLRVTMPVNIRPKGAELKLGNQFGLVSLRLPVFIDDPILRFKEVQRRNDKIKKSSEASASFSVLKTMGTVPANIAKKVAYYFAGKGTAVLSNVPGPTMPLYFAGQKIKNIMFWVPRTGYTGMGISIISYDGKINLGLASDENLISDPQTILDYFREEMHNLLGILSPNNRLVQVA